MLAIVPALFLGALFFGGIAFLFNMTFLPGLIVRLLKRRPLTKPERKKFRIILGIGILLLLPGFCAAAYLLSPEETETAVLLLSIVAGALLYFALALTVNSLITIIPKKKINRT